jgi:hypothetical protein
MAACEHECECLRHTFGCPERAVITHSSVRSGSGGYAGIISGALLQITKEFGIAEAGNR